MTIQTRYWSPYPSQQCPVSTLESKHAQIPMTAIGIPVCVKNSCVRVVFEVISVTSITFNRLILFSNPEVSQIYLSQCLSSSSSLSNLSPNVSLPAAVSQIYLSQCLFQQQSLKSLSVLFHLICDYQVLAEIVFHALHDDYNCKREREREGK